VKGWQEEEEAIRPKLAEFEDRYLSLALAVAV